MFVFSAAAAVAGVLYMFRLKHKFPGTDIREVHYALVILFSFGLYVLWGRLFIRIILSQTKYLLNSDAVINVNQAMGLPFVYTGFLVLIIWLYRYSDLKHQTGLIVTGSVLIMLLTIGHYKYYGYAFLNDTVEVNKVIVALFSGWLAVSLVLVCQCISGVLKWSAAALFLVLVLLNLLTVFLFSDNNLIIAGSNLFYFLSIAFIPVVLYYGLIPKETKNALAGKNRNIFMKYGITAREKEIIQEITGGLTNQQIADKLFITLQTVKDHNSRIYQKLGVKNRTQLVKLLHEDQSE